MVLGLVPLVVAGSVVRSVSPKGRKKKMSDVKRKTGFKSKSSRGTKRFPRGRVVIDTGVGGQGLRVVVGTATTVASGRKFLALSTGRSKAVTLIPQGDVAPVVIRQGKRRLKPRVMGNVTRPKIVTKLRMTQSTLDGN